MAASLYQPDPNPRAHRGAIYQYRPVFWLKPPLWILRDAGFSPPRSATIYPAADLSDAFRRKIEGNEEDVIARAKNRFVVILSNDTEAKISGLKELIIAPVYSIDAERQPPAFVDAVRNSIYPSTFYLPVDPAFAQMAEAYIDFRQVRALHRDFLVGGELPLALTPEAVKAMLFRYTTYLYL